MNISDLLFGLEFLAAIFTLAFILSLLFQYPLISQAFYKLNSLLFAHDTEDDSQMSISGYASTMTIKRSLLNQQVTERA